MKDDPITIRKLIKMPAPPPPLAGRVCVLSYTLISSLAYYIQ